MNEYCIHFNGIIDPVAVQKIVNLAASATDPSNNTGAVHLLMHTGGGGLGDAICLYNLLKILPFQLTAYNVGYIQSAGVVAFLGAKRRVASPFSTFMIHRVATSPQAATGKRLKTLAESVSIDDRNMETILRSALKLDEELWKRLEYEDLYISAEDAVRFGLADEIGDYTPPPGTKIISVF